MGKSLSQGFIFPALKVCVCVFDNFEYVRGSLVISNVLITA
jgi:hypothetical protein